MNQSGIQIAEAAKLFISVNNDRVDPEVTLDEMSGAVYSIVNLNTQRGSPICVDKVVAIYTSNDKDIGNPLGAAQKALQPSIKLQILIEFCIL